MKKGWINVFVLFVATFFLFYLAFSGQSLESLWQQLKTLNGFFLGFAFLLMVLYWLLEAGVLHSITVFLHGGQKFLGSLKTTMVGQFFNSVTPFATGGQPAQLVNMIQAGVPASGASSILTVKFLIYQSVLTIYSIFIMLLKASFFRLEIPRFFFLAEIGFIVNSFVIALTLLFAYRRNFTKRLLTLVYNLLAKLKIIKNPEKSKQALETGLEKFHSYTKLIFSNKTVLFKTTLFTMLQLTAFFLIPYFIYRAFGFNTANWLDILAADAFVTMVTSFVPLPGGSGGAEGGFYLFFRLFFTPASIGSALLVWRVWTFYSCLFFGGLTVLFAKRPVKISTT